MDFKTELKMYQDIVNKELEKYIRKNKCIEKVLNSAMEYSLMAGGKRLRPILVIATYKLFKEKTMPVVEYLSDKYDIYTVSNNGTFDEMKSQIDNIMGN